MIFKKIFLFLIFYCVIQITFDKIYAVEPEEILVNKIDEKRARSISKNIRCVVCQNQSIDESNAPLAKDMRILIREKIKDGKNDKEIYDFLTERYGNFILLNPPFNFNTFFLWLSPFLFIFIGIYIVYFYNKKSRQG